MTTVEFAYRIGDTVEFEPTAALCTVESARFGPYGNCYTLRFADGTVLTDVWESKLNPVGGALGADSYAPGAEVPHCYDHDCPRANCQCG